MPRAIVLTAVLYALSFPKFDASWLAWVALVPLSHSIAQKPLTSGGTFWWGWAAGTLSYTSILFWLITTFKAASLSIVLAIFCLFLLSAYLGLFWGAWTWSLGKMNRVSPFLFAVIGAASWTAFEYIRTWLFSGFPWALLADTQVKHLPLIQIASITGSYGVSFLIVLVNLGLASLQKKSRSLLLIPVLILICMLWGRSQMQQIEQTPRTPIKVALLQGNIDQYKKWDRAYVEDIQRTYEGLVTQASAERPDLIVWPETSVPGYLTQDKALQDWLVRTIKKSQTNHLVGSPSDNDKDIYNSAFSINPEGTIEGHYAKQHLVPFGEVVPLQTILGKFIGVMNELGGFAAGKENPVVTVARVPVGVNICYEAIFPDLVRRSVKNGAAVVANLTNDGWYMRTAAPYQHWAPNIYRAVENRRYVIRANNTGISGVIAPSGRVVAASPIFVPQVVLADVWPKSTLTLYTRLGDWFALGSLFLCIAFFGRVILRPR